MTSFTHRFREYRTNLNIEFLSEEQENTLIKEIVDSRALGKEKLLTIDIRKYGDKAATALVGFGFGDATTSTIRMQVTESSGRFGDKYVHTNRLYLSKQELELLIEILQDRLLKFEIGIHD